MSEDQPEEITIRKEIETLMVPSRFRTFVIVMASGDRYLIEDPAELVLGKDAVSVIPIRGGGYSVLRFTQVSSLEVSEPK